MQNKLNYIQPRGVTLTSPTKNMVKNCEIQGGDCDGCGCIMEKTLITSIRHFTVNRDHIVIKSKERRMITYTRRYSTGVFNP